MISNGAVAANGSGNEAIADVLRESSSSLRFSGSLYRCGLHEDTVMKLGRLPTGIAIVILLTAVSSVFGQRTGVAPPTLPVETAILQDYHPDDLSDRMNQRAPYDKRPFPSPWEELDWDEMGWDAIYEGRAFIERFESTLSLAQPEDLVREGIIEPGRDLTDDPLFLGRIGSVVGKDTSFILIINRSRKSGRTDLKYPYIPTFGRGGELHLGDSGSVIWINSMYFSVRRLTRYKDGYYIYNLTDEGVWQRLGDIPYVPMDMPEEEFPIP